jgi:hypothetical protein
MVTGPNGEPRSVPASATQPTVGGAQPLVAVPGDENWDDGFGPPGPNSYVLAIAVSGSQVYAGGFFTTAGGVAANYIAKWDGANWSALGSGTNHPVLAIAVSGGEVYAGGYFNFAGGKPSSHFGRYVLNAPANHQYIVELPIILK